LAKASNDERKVYTIKDFQNDDIGRTKMKKKVLMVSGGVIP
jgi:hypothetical protein